MRLVVGYVLSISVERTDNLGGPCSSEGLRNCKQPAIAMLDKLLFSLSLSSPHSWIYNRQEGDRVTHEWKNQQSLYFCQRESCIYLLIAANRLFVDVTFSIGKKKTSKWAPFLLFFWLIFQDSFQHFFFFFFFSDFISVPLKRNGSSRRRIENKINRSTSYSLIKKKKKSY